MTPGDINPETGLVYVGEEIDPVTGEVSEVYEAPRKKTPPTPKNLSRRARRYWREIHDELELSTNEELLCEAIVACMTQYDELEAAWIEEGKPRYSKGSYGQLVAHPATTELKSLRGQLTTLLKAMKIEAEPTSDEPKKKPGRPVTTGAGLAWRARKEDRTNG